MKFIRILAQEVGHFVTAALIGWMFGSYKIGLSVFLVLTLVLALVAQVLEAMKELREQITLART